MIIILLTKKLFKMIYKYLQVSKRKSGWTNLGVIEATAVQITIVVWEIMSGKPIGPAKVLTEIFRKGN